MGKRENFLRILALCALVYYTLHPVQSEEKIRPQQQEQQLAFTYNLWQGNIEAGSLRSCPNGFSPLPSSRSRKVVTCEKCNNLGSLSLTCSRWTTETGRITEEENHCRKRGRQTSLPQLVFKPCFHMFDVFRKRSKCQTVSRAEILTIFFSYFGKNDDFINSF